MSRGLSIVPSLADILSFMDDSSATTKELIEQAQATMSTSYNPKELVLTEGKGLRVRDRDGNEYLDFLAGIAVNALGHGHPALVTALKGALDHGLFNVSNAFFNENQVHLQKKLTDISFADRVYFSNSGAEANEAAIKLARRYQSVVKESPRFEIITFSKGFHGRTYAALSATAQPKYHKGFEPMVPGFVYTEYNDLESVRRLIGDHTAAIMVEPIQGEGGVRPGDKEFISGLRELCDEHELLLIFDEVQSGIGRTGKWFAYEHYGVTPDIISLAKGLGGGFPVGAMMATDEVFRGFTYGSHATTFGGNPMSATAALTVIETIERDGLLENATSMGEYLDQKVEAFGAGKGEVLGVRGPGLFKGIMIDISADELKTLEKLCLKHGLLLKATGGVVLRMVPPLTVTRDEIDEAFEKLEAAWQDFASQSD
jgi:predicted acetylornithine/succinylornithine family transaminase